MGANIKIFDSSKENDDVFLRLVKKSDGDIALAVTDSHGNQLSRCNLITFRSDGSVALNSCVNPNFGFELDDDGHLVFT